MANSEQALADLRYAQEKARQAYKNNDQAVRQAFFQMQKLWKEIAQEREEKQQAWEQAEQEVEARWLAWKAAPAPEEPWEGR